jgi:hypothetical protein
MSPKPETVASISRRIGVHRSTLESWRAEGVNLHDEPQLQARLARKKESETSPTLAAAKLAKITAETRRIEFAHDVESGKFVPAHLIEGDGLKIGHAIRSTLDQLTQQLPPQLAGQDAGAIQKILRAEFRRALENLSNYQSNVSFKP